MRMNPLPGTELSVAPIALGCWGLTSDFHWGDRDLDASLRSIDAAIDAGINLFDTAAVYGEGESETLLGKALCGRREKVVLATKILPNCQTEADVRAGAEDSLRRLQTDYIDLYQIHWPGSHPDLETIWETLIALQKEGKTRYIGVCNAGPRQMELLSAKAQPAVNQLPYNLLWRAIEEEILPDCRRRQIGVLAYSPLMHGMLSGRWKNADDVPQSRARSRHFSGEREFARHGEAGCEKLTFDTLARLAALADRAGISLTQLALGWAAARPEVVSLLVGVSSPEQLRANIEMVETPLPSELIAEANAATESLRSTLGPNPDMWQSDDNSRYA